ncbi:MAG TPA: hypothetical protein VMW95_00990, partial [Desulfobacterales bacterium]|nr:hypothetical protein [Desulfobacterales bacterium]
LDFVTLREAIDTAMEKTCAERAGFAVPLKKIKGNLTRCLTLSAEHEGLEMTVLRYLFTSLVKNFA